nr:retrovirus-related Pol polyprotein from transposon TNT 1-94 [Tanacetum cinerariifolium]
MESMISLGQKNTLAEYMILSDAKNRPPMLNKDLYDSWKSRMELYMQNKEHGRMILESVEHNPLIWPTIKENRARVVKCYNCQGEGHMARQCSQPKRPRNAAWYKEKAMLAEAQEAGQTLDEEQLTFLAYPAFLMANDSNYGSDVILEAAQEKEETPQNSDFRQLIEEICGTKVCEEQKKNMEDTMLELLEDCRQKELYCLHNDVEDLIESALNYKHLSINLKSQHLDKEKQEVKNIVEQEPKGRTRLTKCLKNFIVIHKKSSTSLNNTSQISSVISNTPDLQTEEPDNSLSMRDEHLSTIPNTESDEVIKSSVENLVPIPSESEVTFDNERECDVLVNDESSLIFTTFSNHLFDCNDNFTSSDDKSLSNEDVSMKDFKIYSNTLFDDEEIIFTKIDPHHFNAEYDFIKSLLNRDTLIDFSPKFDYLLEEFSSKLAHIDLIPPGIEEADLDLEDEIRLVENLLCDNSYLQSPKVLNSEIADTILKSLSPSPIPVEDTDSQIEEIDLFLATDDLMPPGIENADYESEGDIHFLEELLSDDPLALPENESSNFDHHDDLPFSRLPSEPPDVEVFFDFEPDTGVLTSK